MQQLAAHIEGPPPLTLDINVGHKPHIRSACNDEERMLYKEFKKKEIEGSISYACKGTDVRKREMEIMVVTVREQLGLAWI